MFLIKILWGQENTFFTTKIFSFVGFEIVSAVVYIEFSLLRYNAVNSFEAQQTFRMNMSPSV